MNARTWKYELGFPEAQYVAPGMARNEFMNQNRAMEGQQCIRDNGTSAPES
ncbi:MAG: hypothetical protein AAF649_12510 [Verrucomicrobiota bacterium]